MTKRFVVKKGYEEKGVARVIDTILEQIPKEFIIDSKVKEDCDYLFKKGNGVFFVCEEQFPANFKAEHTQNYFLEYHTVTTQNKIQTTFVPRPRKDL